MFFTLWNESTKKLSSLSSMELPSSKSWWEENWWVSLIISFIIVGLSFFTVVWLIPYLRKRHKEKMSQRIPVTNSDRLIDPQKSVRLVMIGGDTLILAKGDVFSASVPEREGYDFGGWFIDSACTVPFQNGKIHKDIVLYPKWIRQ